jgi:hypothetical protein
VTGAAQAADPNRVTLDNHHDETKLDSKKGHKPAAAHGELITLATPTTAVYDGAGNVLIDSAVPNHPPHVQLNAGAVKTLQGPDGKPQHRVFAFALIGSDGQYVSGWIPLENLDPARQAELLKRDTQIAGEVHAKIRGHGTDPATPVKAAPIDPAWQLAKLRTEPHQDPKQDPAHPVDVNLAEHYCTTAKGVINLCVNVPGTSGHRWGVANDVLPVGTPFHVEPGVEETVPLWEPGTNGKLTGHNLTFVFGYVVDAGEKGGRRYGWLNAAAVR